MKVAPSAAPTLEAWCDAAREQGCTTRLPAFCAALADFGASHDDARVTALKTSTVPLADRPGTALASGCPDAPRDTMKILLADDDAERAGAVVRVLAADPELTVDHLPRGASLADAVAALSPDVVLVDMARPDRDALDGIRQVATLNPRPVVLFVDEDDPSFMEEAIGAGVSSYNALGMTPPDVKPILRAAVALFRRHQQARHDLLLAETRLRERAIVDRAKAVLIRQRRLSEPDAYKWLRRQAMSSGRRIVDIASELVRQNGGMAG